MIPELKWTKLTGRINAIKSPNQFLKSFLFGNHSPEPTETIEVVLTSKGREIAPFVRKNAEAVLVGSVAMQSQTIEAPNIRLKKPFDAVKLLLTRDPGTISYVSGTAQMVSQADAKINREMQVMADMITNAEEYLCSLALQGTITYEAANKEVFTITFPRSSGNTIDLTTYWDDDSPSNANPTENFFTAKQVVADAVGLNVTDAILGSEAATQFRRLVTEGHIKNLNQLYVMAGNVDFTKQFRDDGVIYMGTFCDVRLWCYPRTAILNGVATPMIRAKYVEFVCDSPASDRVLHYGAIPDIQNLKGRVFQGERFSKAWEQEDPSAMYVLSASRPLPVPHQPDATVSMKVVSG